MATTEQRRVDNLQPHPFNQEVYSDRTNDQLKQRIAEHGFKDEHRIVITPNGIILSGHRRWRAVKSLGWDTVPVEVVDVDPESDQAKRRILLANQHREKTAAEKLREAEAWEQLESERAQERMENPRQDFAEGETGRADEKAAKKVGMSRETYRQGKHVKEQADNGDADAQEQWEQMEDGEQAPTAAYQELKQSKQTDTSEPGNPMDAHTALSLHRIADDHGLLLTDDSGETYLLSWDELPDNDACNS